MIDFQDASVIRHVGDYSHRNMVESVLIRRNFDQNLNLSQGLFTLDDFISNAIVNFVKQ